MTDFLLQIGSASFTLDSEGSDFGRVVQELDFGQPARGDLPRLASVRSDSPRTFSFSAVIDAATKDLAIAAVNAANAALRTTNTIVLRSKDATNSVAFRSFPGGSVVQGLANEWELENWQTVQVGVTIEPYAYGVPVTDAHAAVSTPGVVSLSALGGGYPAPLTIEVHPTTGGEYLHSVYFALNEHPEWDGWLLSANAQVWTSNGTWVTARTADASAYTGYSVANASNTYPLIGAIDDTGVPPGEYLVMMRVKMTHSGNGTPADLSVDGYSRWSTTVPGDTAGAPTDIWRWYEVAELALPYKLVRGSGVSTLPLHVMCANASIHAHVDAIALLPTRSGFIDWHGRSDAASGAGHWAASVYFDSAGPVYVDDVCDLTDVTGAPIRSLDGELLVLCDESVGADPTTNLDVSLVQTPRYALYG